jgi:hypothetical protein
MQVPASSSPSPMAPTLPAPGMRRLVIGWTNLLPQIYGDVMTFDDARGAAVHAQHAIAVRAASLLPAVPLAPMFSPLPPGQDAWAKHVTSTPGFLSAFGQQGWQVVRVPLDRLVAWQPIVDATRDGAPPISTDDEIVRAFMPEVATTLAYNATISRDEQGGFHAMLTSDDPNHDLDLSLDDGGAGGLRVRLRPRSNIVHAMLINGRLVVLNGYNRLVRLAGAGHVEAPIVVLEQGHAAAGPIADRPGFLPLNLVASLPRPPLIPDFLNPDLTLDIPKPAVARGHDFRFTHTELPVRR